MVLFIHITCAANQNSISYVCKLTSLNIRSFTCFGECLLIKLYHHAVSNEPVGTPLPVATTSKPNFLTPPHTERERPSTSDSRSKKGL